MCNIKAILFDMDGVLIDAKEWHYEALNRALRLFGYEISRFDHIHTFDGLPTRDKLKLLSEGSNLPVGLHGFLNQLKQQYTLELIAQRCKPVFQHEYALSRLKREGFLLAVCSNSVRNTILEMMDRAKLSDYLDLILSNEDVARAKPEPDIYLAAMKKLGLEAEQCLILEDNKNGIQAAKASGGHLLKVDTVADVNYANIRDRIEQISRKDMEKTDDTYYGSGMWK